MKGRRLEIQSFREEVQNEAVLARAKLANHPVQNITIRERRQAENHQRKVQHEQPESPHQGKAEQADVSNSVVCIKLGSTSA